jgi:hypothetical protein
MRAQPDARTARTHRPHERRDGRADFVGAVLLDEMDTGHADFRLVGPGTDEVQGAAADERTGLAFDEQFGDIALRQPRAILLDGGDDVGGLALNRDVARPRQRRPAIFAGVAERFAVVVHLLVGERAPDGRRQDPLDEDVLVQRH